MSLRVSLSIKTVNPLNSRRAWRPVWRLGKQQKFAVGVALHGYTMPPLPAVITITRVSQGTLDQHDALPASLKHVVDGVAAKFGVDDADPRLTWRYAQLKGRAYAVVIVIEPLADITPEA